MHGRALAWRIAGQNQEWPAIVAITRGELVPAAVVCRELGIRMIETVCIASYHGYSNQGELTVVKGMSKEILEHEGQGVLSLMT